MSVSEAEVLNALCRENLSAFTSKSFTVLEPATNYEHNWHVDCISEHLQAVWDGEIRNIIINMPPRALKTHTGPVSFASWGLGKNPAIRFMLTSFKGGLAEKMTRSSRKLLKSTWYQQCFPGTRISPELDRQYYFETTNNGQYFSSAMSNVTGEGCDIQICFPMGTFVHTDNGERCISELRPSDNVWSFNHESNSAELRRINSVFSRECSNLTEVRTVDGNRVLCTPNHPFWVEERGYTKASDLKAGDRIIQRAISEDQDFLVYNELHLLQERIQEAKSRLRQGTTICKPGILLFEHLLSSTPQHKKSAALRDVWGEDGEQIAEVLCLLQDEILDCAQGFGVLEAISLYQAANRIQRQLFLCGLRFQEEDNRTPYRQRSEQQRSAESNNSLSGLSCDNAQALYTGEICSTRTIGAEGLPVFDITVDGNSNFFSEGILVHNCDDPASPDDAISDTVRNTINETIRGTLFSRFNDPRTGRFILIQQRLHDDDSTGNLLKDEGWYHLKLPAEAKGRSYSYSIRGKTWYMAEGELLFPQRFTREVLDQARDRLGEYNYAGQYLQEPVPIGGGELRPEWVQIYQQGAIKPKTMNVVILVDAAGGEETNRKKRKLSDWTAMMVVGLAPDNNYYLLDIVRDRLNPTERINNLFMLHRKWNEICGKPPKVGYEKYGMMTDTHYIKEKQKQDAYHFPIIEVGGAMQKEERIRRLIPDMQMGRWYFPASLTYVDGEGRKFDLIQEILNTEMKTFPRSRYDDMIDALSRIMDAEINMTFPKLKSTMVGKAYAARDAAADNYGWESY